MQNKKKPSTTTGTKILIASTSLAVTFGMWSWLSYQQKVDASVQNNTNSGDQPAADDPSNLPPIPTLVPLRTDLGAATYNTSAALPGAGVSQQLRSVTAPSAMPTQAIRKPVVEDVIIDSPSTGGGGGGGGGNSKPAARSRSSRPK